MSAYSSSQVGPTHIRSAVVGEHLEPARRCRRSCRRPGPWTPQELLPTMPPIVQLRWVDGLGPNIRPYAASWRLSSSSAMPGSTTQVRASASTETRWWQYFVQSRTTAGWWSGRPGWSRRRGTAPARRVRRTPRRPRPRRRPCAARPRRGAPAGSWRSPSRRRPAARSNRTSPSTRSSSAAWSFTTSTSAAGTMTCVTDRPSFHRGRPAALPKPRQHRARQNSNNPSCSPGLSDVHLVEPAST